DGFYLAAYPVLFVGVVVLLRPFGRLEGRLSFLDATIVTCGFVLVQWVFLLDPAARSRGSVFDRSILVAYPAMDILLVAALARLLVMPIARSGAVWLLTAGIATMLIADESYYGRGVQYHWLDAFWLGSYVTWGAAALHPSVTGLARAQLEASPRLSLQRLGLL